MTQEIGKVKVKSNSLPSSNTTTGAVKVGINNQNAQRVQSIQYSPGSSVDSANNAFEKANNAYDLAVVAYNTGNAAYSTANASYSTGNSAYLTANIIFAKSNTDVNNTNSYISSNVATLRGEITANAASANSVINTNISSNVSTLRGEISSNTNSVFAQANAAYATANAAFESANNVFPQISPAFSQANAAYATANASYAQANSSYGNANTKVSKSGDTMTGTLFLTAPAPGDSLTVANNTGTTLSITREGHLTVFGQANVYERLAVGTGAYTSLPNLISQFTGNSELYSQVNQQNMSANGTGDFVITTNNGTDTVNYADMGMAGNTYNNTTFNAFSFVKPNDGYFMIIGNDGQDYGGNVFYGTTGSGGSTSNVGDITFVQGSNYDEVGTFVRNQGLVLKGLTPSTSNSTGSLVVQGGIGANGAIRGDSIYDSGSRIIHVAQAAFDKANTSSGTANAYTDTANTNLKLYVDGNITANVSILRGEITANAASANSVINSRISANVATLRGEITANAASANSVINTNISANVSILRGEITANAASANSVINTNISANVATLRGEITANAVSANSVINTNISANVATLRGEITANVATLRGEITANAAAANSVTDANISANVVILRGEISSNVSTLRGEITANAASSNSVINTNISANVSTLRGEITANAASANSVINTNISANVSTLRGEISSNVSSVFAHSNAAYGTANAGYIHANSAYDTANTKYSSSGGTIFGSVLITNDLNVSGNIIIGGNTTSLSANNLVINDSIIYLANNSTGNTLDIGLVGHFTQTNYQHTGIVRDHTDGEWKFFSNVVNEPTTTINLDANTVFDSIKVGGISTPYANISGVDILTYSTSSYSTVNTSITNTNSYISSNVSTLRGEITSNNVATFAQANAAYATANAAYESANNVFPQIAPAFAHANAAFAQGNTTITNTNSYISANVAILRGEITANAVSANSVIDTNISANVATLRGEITANANLVYAQANAAYATANAAYESANNVFPQIAPAFAQANAAYAQGNTTITNTNSYISSNVAILRGEITANAVSANSVINTNISANVANLQSEITANAVSANSVINTNISANVALLRGEISSNVLTLNVYSQAAYAQANTGNTTAQAAFDKANTGPSYLVTALATGSNNRITVSAPTGNVSIDLATIPTITSGTYTYPSLIVDSYGRITSITTQTPVTSISANSNSTITQTATSGEVHFDLAPSGVSAGTYGSAISIPTIVVDTYGRLTNVTANSVSTTIDLAGNTGTGTVSGGGTLTLSGSNSISTSVSSETFTITNNGILSFNTRTGVVSLTSSDVTTALGYTPANKAGDTVSGNFTGITTLGANNVTYAHSTTFSTTFTTSTTSPVTIDSFPITSYRSAKYFVQLTSSTSYHVIELSLVHNGTSVYLAQYGEVFTSASLGTFDASIVTGQLNLTFTGANAVTTVKLIRDVINI